MESLHDSDCEILEQEIETITVFDSEDEESAQNDGKIYSLRSRSDDFTITFQNEKAAKKLAEPMRKALQHLTGDLLFTMCSLNGATDYMKAYVPTQCRKSDCFKNCKRFLNTLKSYYIEIGQSYKQLEINVFFILMFLGFLYSMYSFASFEIGFYKIFCQFLKTLSICGFYLIVLVCTYIIIYENEKLKNEIGVLKKRLEDKSNRCANVVVTGLKSKHNKEAVAEFAALCTSVLLTSADVTRTARLSSGKSFIFTLHSAHQADAVIASRNKLKGSKVFIQKDYTADERNNRYHLRQLSKKLAHADNGLKIRVGDFSIFINDKAFSWRGNDIVATNNVDAEFLKSLLAKLNISCEVSVNHNADSTSTSSLQRQSFSNIF